MTAHVEAIARSTSGTWTVLVVSDGDLDTDRTGPPVGDLPVDVRAALVAWLDPTPTEGAPR